MVKNEPDSWPEKGSDGRHMTTAAAASVLLHALLLTGASLHVAHEAPLPDKIAVTIVSPPAPQLQPPSNLPKQIVAPSERPPEEPLVPTPLLSEHSSRAEKETLRRGDPLSESPPAKLVPKSAPSKPSAAKSNFKKPSDNAEPKQVTVPKQFAKLRLNERQLENAFAKSAEKTGPASAQDAQTSEDAEREQKLQQAEPFQRSSDASVFRNRGGSADLLSQIPDGDITLLNAKADQYAVFVRRVALQVFGALRKLNWQELSRGELQRLRGYVTVEAVMDKQGKLVRVTLSESSGSSRFDQITTKAANEGTWDQNPPGAAAANDGNIHFVFKARSWSRIGPNGLNEQRWLMLGTGLL